MQFLEKLYENNTNFYGSLAFFVGTLNLWTPVVKDEFYLLRLSNLFYNLTRFEILIEFKFSRKKL